MLRQTRIRRRGAVLPLVALCMVALVGMVALAIDIGMVAIARSQCQNAADSASMAGARTINGNVAENYNFSAVPTSAVTAASFNKVLNALVQTDPNSISATNAHTYVSGNVKVEAGAYTYVYDDANPENEGFKIRIPRVDATEPYSAVRATVSSKNDYSFGRIFGLSTFNTSATAIAVHRPRDVVIVVDLSGSMRFQSLPGIPYSGSRTTSMNPDPDYPKFGHYDDTAGAALLGNTAIPSGAEIAYYDPANISVETNSGPPILEYFFSNAAGVAPGAGNRAFLRSSSGFATTPGGDPFLKINGNTGATYAHNVKEITNNSTTTVPKFEVKGYQHYTNTAFSGHTEGPGYWGKTFWVWPPIPGFGSPASWAAPTSITDATYKWYDWNDSNPRDWRQRFFVAVNTTGNVPGVIMHNSILFDSDGLLKTPGTTTTVSQTVWNGTSMSTADATYTYRINYSAILNWLAQAPVHFPSTIQAGRIRYYTAIPSGTDNTLNNRWWTTAGSSLPNNERFWKSYIDFVLGFAETGVNTYASVRTLIGNGDYYTWAGSTVLVSNRPQPQPSFANPTAPYMSGTTAPYQTSTTNPYQSRATSPYMTGQVNGAKSSKATSVTVDSLPAFPVANTNYVTFGSSSTVYKITNSNKTSLSITPSLSANVADNAAVKIYSTDNTAGKNKVSISNPSPALTVNSDYIGFNNSATSLYKITAAAATTSAGYELTLGTNLASAVSLSGMSVEVYSSNGASAATKMSVSTLSIDPTDNVDYVGFNNSTTNVYKITAAATRGSAYELTLGSGLATAVVAKGVSTQVYASNGAIGATRMSVTGLAQAPTADKDYVIFGGDTANPCLITGVTSIGSGNYILTVSALTAAANINGATVQIYSPYMDYADDVRRPKHQFWFGPQTWVDWLGNYNTGNFSWPGNVPEAQSWACKVGIQTAIDDIKKNHPSDFVALAFFSHPRGKTSNGNWNGDGFHNRSIVPLGRNYQQLKDSLWFPPTTITGTATEITPFDADFIHTPRAVGGTTPEMGFMLAYNILSNSVDNLRIHTLPSDTYRGNAGGLGRKGASRLIIFETDGAPNRCAAATFNSAGKDSYYSVRLKYPEDIKNASNEHPTVTSSNDFTAASNAAYEVVKKICANETSGGHSTTRKPVQIYSLGYGSLFESGNAGTAQDNAKNFLQTVQYHSGTSSTTSGASFPDGQLIYGTADQRIERMRNAFTSIMQSGVQVSLIE